MQTQQELLSLQTGAEEIPKSKSSQLAERIQVPGTLFIIVGNEHDGYFVTFGKFMVTRKHKTIEECKKLIEKRDWELLFTMMSIAAEYQLDKQTREQFAK